MSRVYAASVNTIGGCTGGWYIGVSLVCHHGLRAKQS